MMSVVDHMNQVFCANVYDEARQIAADDFPQHRRDLFMEQGTQCKLVRYTSIFYKLRDKLPGKIS